MITQFFSLFSTIMKCCITRRLSMFLAGVLVIGSITGCGGGVTINDAKVDLTPTDQLIIELPGYTFLSQIYRRTITDFQTKYPNVEVTVTYIGEKSDYTMSQYQTAINTEIMAGGGPDVVLIDYFFDLYKTMDSGTFVNLNSIISDDTDFHMDDYNVGVMKAGYYKGGQYIMPLGYTLPTLLLGDRETMDNVGFDPSKPMDVTSFLNEINALLPSLKNIPSFYRVDYDSELGRNLLVASGISLVDPETKTVLPDGKILFVRPHVRSAYVFGYYAAGLAASGSPLDIPINSVDGGLVASVDCGLAINANSKNQLNAWNFIKIMLSQDMQTINMTKSTNFGLSKAYPVNNASLEVLIRQQPATVGYSEDIYISDEYQSEFLAILNSVTDCVLPNTALIDMFYAKMKPYFTGDQSLDACISAFKSSLRIYATE